MEKLKDYFNSISDIKEETWNNVKSLFIEKKLNKEDYFVKEGSLSREIAFLETGIVRTYYNFQGKEYNKTIDLAPMFIAGYASLITGKPNQISLQALTDCKIWVANYQQFSSLYDQFPDLERLARKQAELSFVEKEERELEMATLEADKRYELFQKRFPTVEQLIPQYHIASYLGISPTQLSRIRHNYAKKK